MKLLLHTTVYVIQGHLNLYLTGVYVARVPHHSAVLGAYPVPRVKLTASAHTDHVQRPQGILHTKGCCNPG